MNLYEAYPQTSTSILKFCFEGIPCDEKVQTCILKSILMLPEEDRQNILAKFHGAEPQTTQEQNELLMMLLRAYCESKQTKHIHDTAENRCIKKLLHFFTKCLFLHLLCISMSIYIYNWLAI